MNEYFNAIEVRDRLKEVYALAKLHTANLRARPVPVSLDASQAAAAARDDERKHWLECHAREFIINHVLGALNWRYIAEESAFGQDSGNMVIEQSAPGLAGAGSDPVVVADERSRRFDYLGYERSTDRPLLLVEAKRPDLAIPTGVQASAHPEAHPIAEHIALFFIGAANSAETVDVLSVAWKRALAQAKDYVASVKRMSGEWPRRLVLSNGDWLIVFTDPEQVCTSTTPRETLAKSVVVFDGARSLVDNSDLLWRHVEYGQLAQETRELQAGELQFVIDPAAVESCMFGLRVLYTSTEKLYSRRPLLEVEPVVWLRSQSATFIRVGTRVAEEVPLGNDGALPGHLAKVRELADRIKGDIERVLRCDPLRVVSLEDHVADPAALATLPVSRELRASGPESGSSVYMVVTGAQTHMFLPTVEYAACRFHEHLRAFEAGRAQEAGPVASPSTNLRSYFVDRSALHCAHGDVHLAKRSAVTDGNRSRCGHRVGVAEGSPFCGLWGFERRLCCRSCTLQGVCTAAPVFSLPCAAGVLAPAAPVAVVLAE